MDANEMGLIKGTSTTFRSLKNLVKGNGIAFIKVNANANANAQMKWNQMNYEHALALPFLSISIKCWFIWASSPLARWFALISINTLSAPFISNWRKLGKWMETMGNETHITHYIYIGRIQKNTRVDQKWYSSFAKQFNIHQRIYPPVCTSQKHFGRKITIWIVSMMYASPPNNHFETHLNISVRCKLHFFFDFYQHFHLKWVILLLEKCSFNFQNYNKCCANQLDEWAYCCNWNPSPYGHSRHIFQ